MSEFNSRRTPANNFNDYNDRRASPAFRNDDQMTPPPSRTPMGKKTQFSNGGPRNNRPTMSDEQPYKVFRPDSGQTPMRNSFPLASRVTAEMYHLDTGRSKNVDENDDDGGYSDRRSPPISTRNNRVSPVPYGQSNRIGPEMYHIGETKENIPDRDVPSSFDPGDYPKPAFSRLGSAADQETPGKVTVYVLNASNENQRITSPAYSMKKPSRYSPEVNYDPDPMDVPITPRSFPTALRTVPSAVYHVPRSQSKATESIQRSMNKYRFLGH